MVYDVTRLDAASRQPATSADSPGASGRSSENGSSSGAGSKNDTIAMSTFLQLIVAQIRNQDPLNPTDGTQFVAQLAQLQQLQQSVSTGQDIGQIRADMDTLLGITGGTVPAAY